MPVLWGGSSTKLPGCCPVHRSALRGGHQGAAEQCHRRKDADKFLRYRQVKKPLFEAGEHEERILCT